MRDAERLREAWGGKACAHRDLVREYDLGAHTGDFVCRTCGESFTPEEAKELKRKAQE